MLAHPFGRSAGSWGRLKDERVSAPLKMTNVTEDGGQAEVLFRSAENPENLRGSNLSGVWFDEASLMKPEALDVVLACLREKGADGLDVAHIHSQQATTLDLPFVL